MSINISVFMVNFIMITMPFIVFTGNSIAEIIMIIVIILISMYAITTPMVVVVSVLEVV